MTIARSIQAAVHHAPRPPRAGAGVRARRGFTLLEIIVVVAIMAVMATAIVPRLSGLSTRRFDLTVTQAADLIMMFSQREMAGTTPVGIDLEITRDGERRLRLLVLTPPPGQPEATELSEWRVDPFVRPVTLSESVSEELVNLVVDGEDVDIRSSPFTHVPGDRRPRIELMLGSRSRDRVGRIILAPYAIGPDIIIGDGIGGGSGFGEGRVPLDLDAAGRNREDW